MNTTGDFPGENRLEAGEEGHVDDEQPDHPDHEDHHHLHHRQVPQLVPALAPENKICSPKFPAIFEENI